MQRHLVLGSLLVAFAIAGCSSNPALQTESSSSAIRAAEAVGATSSPRAALHLQLAREELDGAVALSEQGKADEATSLLRRAEADAELAILLSREQDEQAQAALAMERVRQLQNTNR
jgi:HEAT repeat protein